ncbi:MAG: DMT family transporter [Candidatus Eisenbacteria bacterium]
MALPLGELSALLAAGSWGVSSVLFAAEREHVRPAVMTLQKGSLAIGFFALVLVAMRLGGTSFTVPRLEPLTLLALSAVFGITIGDTCFFASMRRIGVRKASLLALLNPILAAFLAWMLGQELPGVVGFAGIGLTLVGVLLVVVASPGGDGVDEAHRVSGVLFGAASAGCNAVGIVVAKTAIAEVGVVQTSLLRQLAAFVALFAHQLWTQRGAGLGRELAFGFGRPRMWIASLAGSCIGFLLFQIAIDRASPPVTGALTSTVPLFVAPLAARFLHERLPRRAAIGTLIAVLGVVLLVGW